MKQLIVRRAAGWLAVGLAGSITLSSCNDDSAAIPSGDDADGATDEELTPIADPDAGSAGERDDAEPPLVEAPDGATAGSAFDPQVPPTNASGMTRWLDEGYYLDWVCEADANAKSDGTAGIHVHGATTRICSNVLLAASVAPGTGAQFPSGVAAVKEVYDEADELIARVVSVKADSDSSEGNGWYWYAGPETAGFGHEACTGCHSAAASDADHPGAGDFVYFQTKNEAQLPPVGDPEAVQVWLDTKDYLRWSCEVEPNEKRDGDPAIHVHGRNRVCSNDVLAQAAASDSGWPAGSAAVKELYAAGDGGALLGAVLSLKVGTDSKSGDGWYWYGAADAEGFGFTGCTGCHAAVGSDAEHPGAGDFVYVREAQ